MLDQQERLAERFEQQRERLRAVAYRMLGSSVEADDAVRETWLRLSRADADAEGDSLTTAVGQVSLTMLHSRTPRSGAQEPTDQPTDQPTDLPADPEERALMAVLDTLTPPERLAFVLHDLFSVPIDEIAPVLDSNPAATRQLAARARRRTEGLDEL